MRVFRHDSPVWGVKANSCITLASVYKGQNYEEVLPVRITRGRNILICCVPFLYELCLGDFILFDENDNIVIKSYSPRVIFQVEAINGFSYLDFYEVLESNGALTDPVSLDNFSVDCFNREHAEEK